jgi:hypothetical protein
MVCPLNAFQAKLKQLITRALTLTSSSHAISSITPSSTSGPQVSPTHHHHPQRAPVLTSASFQTLFTISPSDVPNKSAAAMRLATVSHSLDVSHLTRITTAMNLQNFQDDDTDDFVLKDNDSRDQWWQLMALLGERSTVRESLRRVQ